ncbi:MAG TPA: ABC transporter permease [Candidatus Tectomicrobia bacterium]
MWGYIVRRLCFGIPTLLGVTVIVFILLHLAPGDPINAMVPPDAPVDLVQMIRQQMGLDQPLPIQYWRWLSQVARGDLGNSLATRRPVLQEIRAALGNTFLLAIAAACLGFTMGLALGTTAAFFRGRWLDKVVSAMAITGVSLPHYWVAIMLILIFSVTLNWLPAMGMQETSGSSSLWTLVRHMILPSLALSLIPMGVLTRLVRASVLEILQQDFVLTLRAKGLWARTVTWHVMKNAAPPVLTLMGLQFGYLLGGSVLIETVFSWPGSGFLLNLAIFQRDIPMLQGVILVLATFFVLLNLLVDIVHSLIDPRIRRT